MARIEHSKDLTSWQKARELNRLVYEATRKGAFAGDFGLCDQIRRASVSVRSNIENYITECEFKDLYNRRVEVSRLIPGFMDYLQRSELLGNQFKRTVAAC